MKKIIVLLTTTVLFLTIITIFQTGKTQEKIVNILYVGGKELGNYSSIQNAIDNASESDTIFIYTGTYYENIIVNKTINIIGENKENTIINGCTKQANESFSIVFYILANQVKISNLTITNSIIEHDFIQSPFFGTGILIKANNTVIQGNSIKENTFGISLDSSFYNELNNNIITNNFIQISLIESSENIIENNEITNYNQNTNEFLHQNKEIGISFDNAYNNTVINNTISNISGKAIQLSYMCKNNTFYYNNFINNTENANDSGVNNWDNGQYGNYWDDYNESDKNNDGIGDIPYKIPNGNNQDKYPLMMPYDGNFRVKEFYVDYSSVFKMLIIGMILVIIFLIPIAYFWNKKIKL